MMNKVPVLLVTGLLLTSCSKEVYEKRQNFLVENVNIDETIKIAESEIQKDGMSKSLGIWVLRDQIVTSDQAKRVAELYLSNIGKMRKAFNIWHSSWGISNLYRLGDKSVKAALQEAYETAKRQTERLSGFQKKIADKHINGEKIVMGPIHMGGKAYAKRHLVVPGNKKYVQSYKEYQEKEEKKRE